MKKRIIFTVIQVVFCTSLFAQRQYSMIVQTDILIGYSESAAMDKLSSKGYELSARGDDDGLKELTYRREKNTESLTVKLYTKNKKVVRISFHNSKSSYKALIAQLEEERGFKSIDLDKSDYENILQSLSGFNIEMTYYSFATEMKYYSVAVGGKPYYVRVSTASGIFIGISLMPEHAATILFMPEDDSEILAIKESVKQKEEKKRQEEQLRLEEEARAAQEKNYQRLVKNAENALNQRQYQTAKDFYRQAAKTKPESIDDVNRKIAEIDINILCEEAENLLKAGQYENAKEKYADALTIQPNNKTTYINGQIKEIVDFLVFLEERTYKQYDYKTLKKSDYEKEESYIETELRNALFAKGETLPRTTVSIVCEVDTFGVSTANFTTSVQNKNLNTILENISKNLKLKQVFLNNYTMLTKAEFTYTIDYNRAVITAKKNPDGISSNNKDFNIYRSAINSELSSDAPYGKYTFDMNEITINGRVFGNNKLLKMSVSGGPSNAFLSFLVPPDTKLFTAKRVALVRR